LALSKVKNALMGQRFADLSDIIRNVKTLLQGIPENDFTDSGTIVSRSA
jgi:Holliday junction resolvasome RuvABC endonuclease subunit